MVTRRIQRLNEQLRREISEVLRWDVKDPRVGPAAVTRVETSADLSHAKVWVMLMTGDEDERSDMMDGLRAAAVFVRRALSDRLEIRKVPELHFQTDRSMEHAAKIERILGEVLPKEAEAEAEAEDLGQGQGSRGGEEEGRG